MSPEGIALHYQKFHEEVVTYMGKLLGISCKSAPILIKKVWGAGTVVSEHGPIEIWLPDFVLDEISPMEILHNEFILAHETGHVFHSRCVPQIVRDKEWTRKLQKQTLRSRRMLNYYELSSEIFAGVYFEYAKKDLPMQNWRDSEGKPDLYDKVRNFLQSEPNILDSHAHFCKWLLSHRYDEAKYKLKKTNHGKKCREVIVNY